MVGAWDVPGSNPGGIARGAQTFNGRDHLPLLHLERHPPARPRPPSRASNSLRSSPASSSSPPRRPGRGGGAGASGPAPRRHGVGACDDAGDLSGTAAGVSPAWDGRGAGPSPSAAQRFSVDMRRFSSRGARASVNINLGQTQPSRVCESPEKPKPIRDLATLGDCR